MRDYRCFIKSKKIYELAVEEELINKVIEVKAQNDQEVISKLMAELDDIHVHSSCLPLEVAIESI